MVCGLAGKRILIVEDEYFIAADLKRAFQKGGAIVVGPVGNLAHGLALADAEELDAAVLDVNLEGAHSYPIADRLADHAVPYMFLTGYDGWALPEPYCDAPRIAKPFTVHLVMSRLGRLLGLEDVA